MKTPGYDQNRLRQLIAEALDGQLDEAGRHALNETLESSAEARRYYRELMDLHARLHLEYNGGREAEFMPDSPQGRRVKPRPTRPGLWIAAAAAVALLAAFTWRGAEEDQPFFATLETAHSARWGSGELPTKEGSRLGPGKLRLEEGLAVIRFDSGAELSLEAPAELMIVDAMNCRITDGTAVANVPETAIGFRVGTPSAMVIDHGTRFAVSVDPETGGTRTQVFEGLVDVENPATGEVVSLKTGQRTSVEGRLTGPVTEGFDERFQARQPEAVPRSAGWTLLESSKDGYSGYILETDSDQLLYVKHGQKGFHRKAYLGFDLAGLEADRVISAELMLQFEPTGLGLASHVPDAIFNVYGLTRSNVVWNEDQLRLHNAPANLEETGAGLVANEVRKLGSFVVKQGVQRGGFGIASETLADFLRERAGSEVTLIVVRETAETGETGLVHGIASRRHPTLPGPTLAIRLR